MLLRFAWRNLWRNARRTVITVAAFTLGVLAIVTIHSFREVATTEMFRAITRGLVGHVQVHGRGYQASPAIGTTVDQPRAIEAVVARALPAARSEKRVLGAGLASSGETAAPVAILGIEAGAPSVEASFTVTSGRSLGPTAAREAVLGRSLAAELGLAPGGELVLVGQAADGSLANDRYSVVGVADVSSDEGNATTVFLHLSDAQSFFALGEGVHQVIVRLPVEPEELAAPVSVLRGGIDLTRLEVLPWTEILPELKAASDAKRRNMHALDGVIFLIVALGVLNTMSMSTFERTRELGVLAALGTRRSRILAMVVLEALLQGLLGLVAGVLLSWLLTRAMGSVDLSGMAGGSDVMGVRLPARLPLVLHRPSVVAAALTSLVTALAGGFLPALRASRLRPAAAARYV